MQRLLRFFVLMALRVAAVVTIILWGVSQVGSLLVFVPVAGTGMGMQTASDGYIIGIIQNRTSGIQFTFHENNRSLQAAFEHDGNLIPGYLWGYADHKSLVGGVSYLLSLVTCVLLYAIIEYAGRRRRRSSLHRELSHR